MTRERVLTFGEGAQMVGVLGQPDGEPAAGAPGVLLLNAGLLHRVGPARLNVELGRRLAARGLRCLRFDLSGLGDSEARRDQRSEVERAVLDIQQAIRMLETRCGLERFVLIGLCSGADNAHLTAVADERVAGLVLLDPYGYRTPGFMLRHYGKRVLKLGPWVRFARRTAKSGLQAISQPAEKQGGACAEVFERYFPPQEQVAEQLQALVRRDVEHLIVYSGGVREEYLNDRRQFGEMFPALDDRGRIELDYNGEADHVYTLQADRAALIDRICGWFDRHYL